MGKLEQTVAEFLSESEKSYSSAVALCQQEPLVKAIFQLLEEHQTYSKYLEPVCEQLFKFCRSDIEDLQRFSSYYIPTALSLYLRLSRHPAARGSDLSFLEVYLLAAYNIETCDPEGKEVVHSFTVPALYRPSIYHESIGVPASAALTENALSRLEQGLQDIKVVIGPFKEALRITRENIHQIASLLMRVYNANISYMPNISREATLRGAQKVISQKNPRIELGTEYLLEVLHCAYFSMFNGQYVLGNETIAMIRLRGRQSLIPEVCLVANAMKQSLLDSKDKTGDAMGIRIVNSSFKNLTKNVLTNASFRTRKLSEDSEDEDQTSTASSAIANTKRDIYKSQLHDTLGSIDEGIEISQVHVDGDGLTVGIHKSSSSSSSKVRKGSLVLVDSDGPTAANGSGSTSTVV